MMIRHRGMSLLELSVAGVILVTLLTLCLQVFRGVHAQHRAVVERELALQEAANLMERLMASPWDQLTPENTQQLPLSPEFLRTIPDARLTITITPASDLPSLKRLHLLLSWPRAPEQPDQRVELVAWKGRGA